MILVWVKEGDFLRLAVYVGPITESTSEVLLSDMGQVVCKEVRNEDIIYEKDEIKKL